MANSDTIDATHPLYDCRVEQWQRCRDCWDGQDAIKKRLNGHRYLPPTQGQILDGIYDGNPTALGKTNYTAYLARALFMGFYADAVQMALGLAWTKPPQFEGLAGTPMEYILEKATNEGESLERLLYRINEQQMGISRIGLLADLPAGETRSVPYISTYTCESIKNWDASFQGELAQETLNLVVLDECGPKRIHTFGWDYVQQYRVLTLGPVATNEISGEYRQGVFQLEGTAGSAGTPIFDETLMFTPSFQGRKLEEIPFVFINSCSTTSNPVDPPLLSLADLAISLYQICADYHQELHASTQATLCTKGTPKKGPNDEAIRIGAGSHLDLGMLQEADAWFLELSGKGLPELRNAVNDKKELCQQRAGEIVDQSSRARESGNALEQRISVRTASLHSIVQNGADGLEKLLKIMARWHGMSETQIEAIKVKPNFLFSKPGLSAIELKSLAETKLMGGAVVSLKSIHTYLVARGFTTLSFEEMTAEFESEKALAKSLLPPPELDPTKTGGPNGGPKVTPASTGF
jgi:hypothetical protein